MTRTNQQYSEFMDKQNGTTDFKSGPFIIDELLINQKKQKREGYKKADDIIFKLSFTEYRAENNRIIKR